MSPAHESTGTVIKTADEDLANFLEGLLDSKLTKSDDNFVIMIASDHGRWSNK